ncbi:unnamed protein product [Penicillium camemberti]|uniref:Str. FM013 n=1 Tax=Penicillium camemberti (strain FM 013) TaxID=1429867 RepID=A0A0G4P790_PENC3|nr:unnamed protein product [Penicillium camemberti]
MSRNFFPAIFAIGPTFQQLQYERQHAQKTSHPSDPVGLKQDTNSPTKADFQQDPKSTTQ